MHLQHLFTTFRSCNSQPRQLDLLEDNSLLMSFEDGCVRICDPVTALDTTITLPQLSITSPRYVRCVTCKLQPDNLSRSSAMILPVVPGFLLSV
jgi:hypothetical protein